METREKDIKIKETAKNFDLHYLILFCTTRYNIPKEHFIQMMELGKKKDVPFYFRERLLMKEKMNPDESRKIYSLRKITVEPVYGHMKQNLGFRKFLLRGLEKVKIEMNLISIAHNLLKIHRILGENKRSGMRNSNNFC